MRRLLIVLLLAALGACTQQHVSGETAQPTRIVIGFQPPDTCSMVIGGKTYFPETDGAATAAALKRELALHPNAQLVGFTSIPYKCVGGAIVELQRAGFKKIGFISEPPPVSGE